MLKQVSLKVAKVAKVVIFGVSLTPGEVGA